MSLDLIMYLSQDEKVMDEALSHIKKGSEKINAENFPRSVEKLHDYVEVKTSLESESFTHWIHYVNGIHCSGQKKCQTKDFFLSLSENVEEYDLYFFLGYTLSDALIDKLSKYFKSLDTNNLLGNYEHVKDEYDSYLSQFEGETPEGVMDRAINYWNNYQHIELSEPLDRFGRCLINQKKFDKWLQLCDKLRYPSFQGQLLANISLPEDCADILEALTDMEIQSNKELLASGILSHWARFTIDDDVMAGNEVVLIENGDLKRMYDLNKREAEKWKSEYDTMVKRCVLAASKILSPVHLIKWAYSNPYHYKTQNEYSKANSKLYELITNNCDEILKNAEVHNEDKKDKNVAIFEIKREISRAHEHNTGLDDDFMDHILECIVNKKHTADILDESTLSKMALIATGLGLTNAKYIDKTIERYTAKYEGYGAVTGQEMFNVAFWENYIWRILLLMTQNDMLMNGLKNREEFFVELVEKIFEQRHCYPGSGGLLDYYKITLILCELIADQILTKHKQDFESRIVREINPFTDMVEILSNAQNKPSETTLDEIRSRTEKEWPIWKGLLTQRKDKELIKRIEKTLQGYGIPVKV